MNDGNNDRKSVILAYALYGLGLIPALQLATIGGIIVNHIKINEVSDPVLKSHHRWLMRTFWFAVLWALLGSATVFIFGIGYLVLTATAIWFIYRLIRGWLNFSEGAAV